jgi:hypothetical protein
MQRVSRLRISNPGVAKLIVELECEYISKASREESLKETKIARVIQGVAIATTY